MKLVTIETFRVAAEAELAKSALDAAGIENVMDDVEMMNMAPHIANMTHGISLRVRREDFDRAREVLDTEIAPPERSEIDDGESDGGESDDSEIERHDAQPVLEPGGCPQCGSLDVLRRSERFRTFALIAVAVLGVGVATGLSEAAFFFVLAFGVYAMISGRSRCNDCGESWY